MKLQTDADEYIFTNLEGKTVVMLLTEQCIAVSCRRWEVDYNDFQGDGMATIMIPFEPSEEK